MLFRLDDFYGARPEQVKGKFALTKAGSVYPIREVTGRSFRFSFDTPALLNFDSVDYIGDTAHELVSFAGR